MIIEILFEEICNLYGDPQNAVYLSKTVPSAEFVHTSLDAVPFFADSRPDIILIGSMSDNMHSSVIEKLKPYRQRIIDLINDDVVFLVTGSACEVFCNTVENVTLETKIPGLGIVPFDAKINWFDRYNGKVLASFNGMKVTGFKSQFSMLFGSHKANHFADVERGIGINRASKLEGYKDHNFFLTQILGPILPLNPEFCEYIISLTGETANAAFKAEAMEAFNQRLKEFSDPKIKFD
jgi:CobQ-like glutamine amidotransferase family enzyme